MVLTEEEAKEKACCKERAHLENGKLVTPGCLASECMAWRWEAGTFIVSKGRFAEQGDEYLNDDYCLRYMDKGYCGLAGEPQHVY